MQLDSARIETRVTVSSETPIVKIIGEIDVYTAPEFKKAVKEALSTDARNLVIDLCDVSYMDSSGFGILLSAAKQIKPKGGNVNLVGCSEAISRLLAITKLDSIFGLYSDVNEAL